MKYATVKRIQELHRQDQHLRRGHKGGRMIRQRSRPHQGASAARRRGEALQPLNPQEVRVLRPQSRCFDRSPAIERLVVLIFQVFGGNAGWSRHCVGGCRSIKPIPPRSLCSTPAISSLPFWSSAPGCSVSAPSSRCSRMFTPTSSRRSPARAPLRPGPPTEWPSWSRWALKAFARGGVNSKPGLQSTLLDGDRGAPEHA